jgi:predicted aconitase with swiveling domain
MKRIPVHMISAGVVRGEALVSKSPLSFHVTMLERETGIVRWKGHELEGMSVKGKVVVVPVGKGSTGGSWSLIALARHPAAPAAIVCNRIDNIIAAGAIVGGLPAVACLDQDPLHLIATGDDVLVDANNGWIEVVAKGR